MKNMSNKYKPHLKLVDATSKVEKGGNRGFSWFRCNEFLKTPSNKILTLRILLISSLIIAAGVCSTLGYFILRNNEMQQFESQYNSIADSALNSVVDSFDRMNLGLQEMSSIVSHTHPDAHLWPNVVLSGFYRTARLLGRISSLDSIALSPIVRLEELNSYEDFMSAYYESEPEILKPFDYKAGFKMGTVWALNLTTFGRYRDSTGESPYSPYALLTPAAQVTYSSQISPQLLGYNLHSDPRFSYTLDQVICCTASHNYSVASTSCGAISDAVGLPYATSEDPSPAVIDMQALLTHPIFPANNQTVQVGFASGAISWMSLLLKVVPTFVSGLDCVIQTDNTVFTYTIQHGVPIFKGKGDLHDPFYASYKRERNLLKSNVRVSSTTSYSLSLYPRSDYMESYMTNVPIMSAVALILVFLFCSILFFAYDVLMKREFSRKQAILDTKRRFVRFISHEIRTPLNTVRLGLKLFSVELDNLASLISQTPLDELVLLFGNAIQSWKHLAVDILENSESAVEVLDDLLNYDKIEMGTLRLEFSLFNIWELVNRVTSIMQIQAQQKDIALELCEEHLHISTTFHQFPSSSSSLQPVNFGGEGGSQQSDCKLVVGDISRMGQVLRNLISNALKFTPSGGRVLVAVKYIPDGLPEAEVLVDKTQASELLSQNARVGSIHISVKDSGAGLSPKQLSEICAEGVQFNANELQAGQGSGLGLFISKGIVEQHGGKLTVSSEGLNKGVTFVVELPLYQPPPHCFKKSHTAAAIDMPISYPSILATQKSKIITVSEGDNSDCVSPETTVWQRHRATQRMLVVDDSHFNRKMLSRLLTSTGYVCEQAEDGKDAIRKYIELLDKNECVDVILMDFEMPIMNGPTATRKLRELGCTCLIVGVTGNVLPEDIALFIEHGADSVLPKPLKLDDFEEILRNRLTKQLRPQASSDAASPGFRSSTKDQNEINELFSSKTVKIHPLEIV